MGRVLSYMIALLCVVDLATSAVSLTAPQAKKHDEQSPQSTGDDSTTTGAKTAQATASWEIQADGSVFSKQTSVTTSVDGAEQDQNIQNEPRRVTVNDIKLSGAIQESKEAPLLTQDFAMKQEEYDQQQEEGQRQKKTIPLLLVDPSETFLELEDRITDEGYTPKLVEQLREIAGDRHVAGAQETAHDWAFALTKLAFMQLFEPNSTSSPQDEEAFANALRDLRLAADCGVQSAVGVLTMLTLVDIPIPQAMGMSTRSMSPLEKQTRADQVLVGLAGANDFMATLAVGYGLLSGRLPVPSQTPGDGTDAVCDAALPLFHTCAEQNVRVIVDEGAEHPVEVARLSDELLGPTSGGFLNGYGFGGADPLRNENEALHELEYYRTVANNPMDEQYPEAMQRLGEIYFFGNPAAHVAPDHALAAQYFRQAADAGDPLAQANYAMLLANGMGVEQDVPQALVYFNQGARQNEAFAFHGLGVLYFAGTGVPQNVTLALEFFEKAIARGYAESHSFLGSAYLHGNGGIPIDYDLAFMHFQAAVDGTGGQSSQALFNLGVMHFKGIGTAPSCATALPLFRSVALHPDLLSSLPFSLIKGYECFQKGDFLRAYLHYRLVAELGDEDAQCNAAFLLEHHGENILEWRWLGLAETPERPKNPHLREAFALYSHAAALNDSEAVRKIGTCFHEPWVGVCQANHTRALERYKLAAELGDTQAGYNCGLMLLTGDGVQQDLVAARNYYTRCSESVFPSNVPCTVVLFGLDIIQLLRTVF
ncbi:Protein sel-1 3 [Phytophthora boehmeriae]|uniref:Protein sel-1 3 n=1 Tax=Phytophthora boehmeriae TaxID=109152 RepID=A0A8T1X3U5_9STRA|nr:Protein sel-1 3 [Phytophthora boehmeriae]